MQNEDILVHHGILGMKWGVRRYQNPDGTLTEAGRKRYGSENVYEAYKKNKAASKQYSKDFSKAVNNSGIIFLTKKAKEENNQRWDKAYDSAVEAQNAYKNYKKVKSEHYKKAVKEYSKQYDKANKMAEEADLKWKSVKSEYLALGKNRLSRVITAMGKSKASLLYSKHYDEASEFGDKADEEWAKASELYLKTGKNRINRILNNMKYDPIKLN